MKEWLIFNNLFKEAIAQWPEIIELKLITETFNKVVPTDKGYDLVCYNHSEWDGTFENYIVENLTDLSTHFQNFYWEKENAIIIVEIHRCISIYLYKLAKFVTRVPREYIRPEAVKEVFNEQIRWYLDHEESALDTWKPKDLDLIRTYFEVNPSLKHTT